MTQSLYFLKNNKTILIILLFLITVTLKENLNSVSLIILFIYSIYNGFTNKINIKQSIKSYIPLLLYFVFIALSLLINYKSPDSQKYFLKNLPFLIIPISFTFLKLTKREYRIILQLFIVWLLINTLYSHTIILKKLITDGESLSNLFRKDYSYLSLAQTIRMHSTYYSFYILVGVVVLMDKVINSKNKISQIRDIVIVAYFSFFVIHLSSRTNIIALIFIVSLFILVYFIRKKNLWKGIISLSLCLLIITICLYNIRATRYRFQQIVGMTFHNGTRHDDGLNKIKQFEAVFGANNNSIVGNGISNANAAILDSYLDHDLASFAKKKYNGHNQYLQNYVGMGLMGVFILMSVFIYYFYFFRKNKNLIAFSFIIICSILFLTESYLERHKGIVLFVFFICLNICYTRSFLSSERIKNGNTNIIKNHKK